MKKQLRWAIMITIIPVALFTILSFNNAPQGYEPVLMTRKAMEAAVQFRNAREIEKPGKMWVFNEYIFVIEQYRGIHILDNTDPSSPVNMGFIQVDGCTDVAVKQGLIYANNAVDLIGIKPELNSKSIQILSRSRDVLPELEPPDGMYFHNFHKLRPENTIIVRYEPYSK